MPTRVVIIGGGFGGLEAALSLRSLLSAASEITVIDRSLFHSFIPSIHLIVSGKATPREIQIPFQPLLGTAGIRFVQDEVLAIDNDKKQVLTGRGASEYDYLVLGCGAVNNFFSVPGAHEFSCRFRAPEDAARIREQLLGILKGNVRPCRIVIAGAGTEGVEIIGEILDLIELEGREDEVAEGSIVIELIEGKKSLLPAFPREVQERVEQYLLQQGVVLTAGDGIAGVTEGNIRLVSGGTRAASLLIWSGGIQPSGLIRGLSFAKDPWGWLKVTDFLRVPEDERVFGIGDAVSIYTDDGPLELQRRAYHAQDQARIAALNIAAGIKGRKQVRYEAGKRPQLISLGKNMGVLTSEEKVFAGAWVVSLKKAIERKHLVSYLSRPVSVAVWSRLPGVALLQRLRMKIPA